MKTYSDEELDSMTPEELEVATQECKDEECLMKYMETTGMTEKEARAFIGQRDGTNEYDM